MTGADGRGCVSAAAMAAALFALALSSSRVDALEVAAPQAGAPSRPPAAGRAGTLVVSPGEVMREALILRRDGRFDSLLKTATVDGLDEVARAILDRKLLASEARLRGLHRERGVIELTTRAVDLVLVETLLARVKDGVDVGEAAARAFYGENGDRFRSGARRRARHIVVASEEEIREAQRELAAGRPFAEVASSRNSDPTRKNGGDLGWITPGTMVRDFDAAVFGLTPGQVSDPVRTGMGFHLVTVEEVDPGTLPSFELVKDKVADAMRADAVARLLATLRQANPVAIDRIALDALLR